MATRRLALALLAQGRSVLSVSRELGVAHRTIRSWRNSPEPKRRPACFRCDDVPVAHQAYPYLLGLFLGDGHIVAHARSYSLSIYCANDWPGLIDDAQFAIDTVLPGSQANRVMQPGCTEVKRYSQHWPCLFPQHGPGMKHTRKIELADWQRKMVEAQPWPFIRGLIHSDGCRITNWTVRTVAGKPKRYEYPRYMFSNESTDIKGLFTWALDMVGVAWKVANRKNISIARKEAVALMDLHVGPKY